MSASGFAIKYLWPFLKELVLGDKTVREAIRTNKMRVFVLLLIVCSFLVNFNAVPRLWEISASYVKLEKKYDKLLQEGGDPEAKALLAQAQADLKRERSNHGNTKQALEDAKKDLALVTAERDVLKAKADAGAGKPNAWDRYEFAKEQLRKLEEESRE